MKEGQSTMVSAEHRICERMLLALNAPVTESNIAKLGLFAGILSTMNANTGSLDAVEALIMGIDMANMLDRSDTADHFNEQEAVQ